mmetsp:Transcript_8461/g.24186  ORF Transcript_8461/g.24186 Transcript_8461/m.24186 type:complete len:85 (-) Transcript_8461:437-691(-)
MFYLQLLQLIIMQELFLHLSEVLIKNLEIPLMVLVFLSVNFLQLIQLVDGCMLLNGHLLEITLLSAVMIQLLLLWIHTLVNQLY